MNLRDRVGRVEKRADAATCPGCGRPAFGGPGGPDPAAGADAVGLLVGALTPEEKRAVLPALVRAMRRVQLSDAAEAARDLAGAIRHLAVVGLTTRELYELFTPDGS